MNAQTQISTQSQLGVGLLNLESFELSQRIAKMLSNSTLVPEQYRAVIKVKAGKDQHGNWIYREEPNPSGLSNCVIALNMSNRMGADPLMVMQNLYLIEGRPAWSSQFIMAAINSCGRFSALRFEMQDLGEKEVEYTETVWNGGRKNNVSKKLKINDMSCVAWVEEKGSVDENGKPVILKSSTITIEMAVKEGWYQKNGSKWQTMPEQMLRYRAASFFGRVYAPELLMGLRSAEEEQDAIIDVTPVEQQKVDYSHFKLSILKAKSSTELEEIEKKVLGIADEDAQSELMKLVNAQASKIFKASEAQDVEVIETFQEAETPPVEEPQEIQPEQPKKPTSAEARKDILARIAQMNNVKDLETVIKFVKGNDVLTDSHKTYLINAIEQKIESLKPKAEQSQASAKVDPNKSKMVLSGILTIINESNTLDDLVNKAAQSINDNDARLIPEHLNDAKQAYAVRKHFLENQVDMFAEVDEGLSYADAVIKRIQNAQSQDDINAEYADPAFDTLPEDDVKRIDAAAAQREKELQG